MHASHSATIGLQPLYLRLHWAAQGRADRARGPVNFLHGIQNYARLTAADRLLAVTTLGFDIAGLELFLPLVQGACVVLASRETLFIVGGNGSGKSTLAKLLTGLYQPSAGRLSLQGVEIGAQRRDWYRSHFATVFSSFHLSERLVGPQGDFDPQLAQAWLLRLRMEHKVSIDPAGMLSTTQLSQGQRKRLALLVALVEERPILLLDEWAADQDPAFRSFLYLELLPELKVCGKTVIAISHDDRYFAVADRVIKCDGGQLRTLDKGAFSPEHLHLNELPVAG